MPNHTPRDGLAATRSSSSDLPSSPLRRGPGAVRKPIARELFACLRRPRPWLSSRGGATIPSH